jgi:hypothetical protein
MAERVTIVPPGTELECLLGKTKAVFSNGQVTTREEYDRWSAEGTLGRELKRLESAPDRNGWDFKYAVSTGDLRKRRNIAQAESTRLRRVREEWQAGKAKKDRRQLSSDRLVEAAMLLVGLGGAVMSAYHTASFLIAGGKPGWTGWTTGVIMIIFSATAFTLARILANKLSILVAAVGVSVVAFSMFSTVTVNFNQFAWRDEEAAVASVADSEALAAHQRLLRLNEAEIAKAEAEAERLDAEADHWKNRSWAKYDQFVAEASAARRRRQELAGRQAELELSVPELVREAAESETENTIYALLGRLFQAREDAVRFVVYVIPSCFYDLAAPLALSVVFLLEDRRRRHPVAAGGLKQEKGA